MWPRGSPRRSPLAPVPALALPFGVEQAIDLMQPGFVTSGVGPRGPGHTRGSRLSSSPATGTSPICEADEIRDQKVARSRIMPMLARTEVNFAHAGASSPHVSFNCRLAQRLGFFCFVLVLRFESIFRTDNYKLVYQGPLPTDPHFPSADTDPAYLGFGSLEKSEFLDLHLSKATSKP